MGVTFYSTFSIFSGLASSTFSDVEGGSFLDCRTGSGWNTFGFKSIFNSDKSLFKPSLFFALTGDFFSKLTSLGSVIFVLV